MTRQFSFSIPTSVQSISEFFQFCNTDQVHVILCVSAKSQWPRFASALNSLDTTTTTTNPRSVIYIDYGTSKNIKSKKKIDSRTISHNTAISTEINQQGGGRKIEAVIKVDCQNDRETTTASWGWKVCVFEAD